MKILVILLIAIIVVLIASLVVLSILFVKSLKRSKSRLETIGKLNDEITEANITKNSYKAKNERLEKALQTNRNVIEVESFLRKPQEVMFTFAIQDRILKDYTFEQAEREDFTKKAFVMDLVLRQLGDYAKDHFDDLFEIRQDMDLLDFRYYVKARFRYIPAERKNDE